MIWMRAIAVWLLIIVVESIHGTLRTFYLEPALGGVRARQISVFTGCMLIGAIALLSVRWIGANTGANTTKKLLAVGVLWVTLTLIFEFIVVGPALGYSAERMTDDYDLSRGGLMLFGILFMALAPLLAARIRRIE